MAGPTKGDPGSGSRATISARDAALLESLEAPTAADDVATGENRQTRRSKKSGDRTPPSDRSDECIDRFVAMTSEHINQALRCTGRPIGALISETTVLGCLGPLNALHRCEK